MNVRRVLVLGAGSAGLMAAITLKRRLPQLDVQVVRSPELGIIGVGEGTTLAFPKHFFEYLKLQPQGFYDLAEPTWKLGLKFLWGPHPCFFYTFAYEFQQRLPELNRNNGFYYDPSTPWAGPVSAFMAHDKAFPRRPNGEPQFHNSHAYHIENTRFVAWLERLCATFSIPITNATVRAERADDGTVAALVSDSGERWTADLYLDASGFRSEILGRTLDEPFLSYADTLFCDRAVIAGWPRTDEPVAPYTTVETMNAGWCWQIEHEHFINRGYVFASAFLDDDAALAELRERNPKLATEPRVVRFRSGRRTRNWVGNVVGIGNSVGFVEPLEATALQIICVETSTLADSLLDSLCQPTPTLVELYNRYNGQAWDDIRDFLAVHYKFNTRLDTPFWRACRADTPLHGAQFLVDFYRENGPSVVAGAQLLHASNSFGMDGYLALLIGQDVPHQKPYPAPPGETAAWRKRCHSWAAEARRGLDVPQCLASLRRHGVKGTAAHR
ncbi:MAG: tryptophan 7-halogenase [Verrucomicrobiae bacterium]|nr:tryptophan 7-halogenase [Verrucomicrobiae bacterium]